jgi:PTS system ascorbate-specific IIC component
MVCGMLANILIARCTPLKFIFLTGHHTLFMAALFAAVLHAGGLPPALVVVIGAALLGVVMAFFPFLAQGVMRKVTGGDDFALGHFGTTGYVVAAVVGRWAGRNSKSTEDMAFPKSLLFFRETIVAISATMLLLFLIVMGVVASREGVEHVHQKLTNNQNFLVFSTLQALTFAAGIYVVLQGVRLILSELVPAFKGISERLVPNAKPALDCPVVFPYAPNAVVLGFVSSFAGGLAALAVCGLARWTLILPGVVPHFFCGATAGVFGNATGGRRGCVAGAFVHGLLITFLPLLLLPTLGNLGFANTTFGDADFGVVGTLLGGLVALFRR